MDQKKILRRIHPYLGGSTHKIEMVDEIPVFVSGKRKYIETSVAVISSIKDSVNDMQRRRDLKERKQKECNTSEHDGRTARMNANLQIVVTPLQSRLMGAEQFRKSSL